jgi:hypothetical protein
MEIFPCKIARRFCAFAGSQAVFFVPIGFLCCCALCLNARAQTNSWTNTASANWEDPDWSLGMLPGTNQTVFLTNAGWKAVEIGQNTSENYSQSLGITSLTISSPTNSFNEVLMNYAGLETPLVIDTTNFAGALVIESNAAFVMLSSSLMVGNGSLFSEQGAFSIGGTFIESAGSQVTASYLDLGNIGAGSYDLTNSSLQVYNNETIGGFGYPAMFNQNGGSNTAGNLFLEDSGEYDFYGGYFGCPLYFEGGTFNQWGGTINGLIAPWDGVYSLAGGTFIAGGLSLPSGGYDGEGNFEFSQTGGTNYVGNISLGGGGGGTYTLTDGTLVASSLDVGVFHNPIDAYSDSGNTFIQAGGYHTNGAVSIEGEADYYGVFLCYYRLSGGTLATPSISVNVGQFVQSGGTNDVGAVSIKDDSNYQITGGELSAGTISMTGTAFVHSGGILVSPPFLILTNGIWNEGTNGVQLGQLQLGAGTNSVISFPSGPSILQFAGSSSQAWSTNAELTIQNWNGSLYGGGQQQLIFGSSQTALTAQQLTEVQFQNPAGLPAGTYLARILADGEVAPDSGSPLPLELGLASSQSNGSLQLLIQGDIGQTYEIDASTDLEHWVPLSTLTNSTGTVSFSDSGASNYSQRFYRAQLSQ